jgi:hypothetical protein
MDPTNPKDILDRLVELATQTGNTLGTDPNQRGMLRGTA